MNKTVSVILLAGALTATAQNYATFFSRNDNAGDPLQRTFQYYPTDDGYIATVNGNNRYTRALYGGNTLWRLETSDRPVFGAYHKKDNRNISFYLQMPGSNQPVNIVDADKCTSLYRGGERIYRLSDPSWKGGHIELTALSRHDMDGAVWKVEAHGMPAGSRIVARCYKTVNVRMNRSGDLGADPANIFDAMPGSESLSECSVNIGGRKAVKYIGYLDRQLSSEPQNSLKAIFIKADADMKSVTSRLKIETPDPYINTLDANLMAAGDGIWDGDTYLHGAIGWRMPLAGWRGAYTGDFLGWHDRARNHFNAYSESQVRDVPPVYSHPMQDSTMAMARAEKRWGSPMYSNGYICRNPRRNDTMHHYDMNLCFIDELLWHFNWTGDTAYMRRAWPVLKASLEWEKRNFDPDDDGLYDAYCCIWASDALYYNGGGVTHSSAYNYRANRIAATVAGILGENPAPYKAEADKIKSALQKILWLPEQGVWAEFKDVMGHGRLHDHPAIWTVYHAIDSDVATPFEYHAATRFIDRNIPRFPIKALGDSVDVAGAYVLSTTDWLPYSWSINNVAHAETLNAALANWQARRIDNAFKIFKGMVLDGMFLGASPGNIGQISHYDAARGESYRDFADPVGVMSRALVQGLFGFAPDLVNRRVSITPGFPAEWEHASIQHPDFTFKFKREGRTETYNVVVNMAAADTTCLYLHPYGTGVESLSVDGSAARFENVEDGIDRPMVKLSLPAGKHTVVVRWSQDNDKPVVKTGRVREGFEEIGSGDFTWWIETAKAETTAPEKNYGIDLMTAFDNVYSPVDMSGYYNASVTDIFRNKYLSPRPETTTLRLPVQGIGEWCHPLDSATIDDSGLRSMLTVDNDTISLLGIPFKSSRVGNNIVYTSLFDNYPDSVTIPLSGYGRGIELLLAGSTNHMQCHLENARVTVRYADGTEDVLPLIPPFNWCPIEQDYYIDSLAFKTGTPRPYRFTLKSAHVSRNLEKLLKINGVYGRRIDGGAATLLCLPLQPAKQLRELILETVSNDVVVGLMAATIIRPERKAPVEIVDINNVVDNTPDSLKAGLTARPRPASTRRGDNPVLFLVGNSTMRTGTKGNGNNGQWGWGYYLHEYFDPEKITVENHALGGMSTRTFYNRLWPEVRDAVRPGDYVIIELGHNDNGPFDSGRARATIPGIGKDSLMVTIAETGVKETVYTYGEYLRRFINEVKQHGGTPILMSLTPRNAWDDADSTVITRVNNTFGGWAEEVAAAEGVPFVDLNDITACKYEKFGKEKVKYMFYLDRIHTSAFGARVNAESAVEGIVSNPSLTSLSSMTVAPPHYFEAGLSRIGSNPVTFIIGDSTVKNEDDSKDGMWGWGAFLGDYVDSRKTTIENHAKAGRSARTFVTEGRWDNIYKVLQPGDFVLIQLGHNDGGNIDSGRERASLSGNNNQSKVFRMAKDGRYEVVYTYGWYLTKIVNDAKEKGAIPILISPTARNIFKDGAIKRFDDSFSLWCRDVADKTGCEYIDFNAVSSDGLQSLYDRKGVKEVNSLFKNDHTHTSLKGARNNAKLMRDALARTSFVSFLK